MNPAAHAAASLGKGRPAEPSAQPVNPRPPVITESPLSQTVVPGSTATFAVAANGTIPLTYAWELDGGAISGAAGMSYTTGPTTASAQSLRRPPHDTARSSARRAVNVPPA